LRHTFPLSDVMLSKIHFMLCLLQTGQSQNDFSLAHTKTSYLVTDALRPFFLSPTMWKRFYETLL